MTMPSPLVGTWQITLRTPLGRLNAELSFVETPDGLAGVATGQGETVPLTGIDLEPSNEGHRVTWSQRITRPIRLDLAFDVLVSGDQLTGTSRAGRLPRSTVSGTRQPELARPAGGQP